MKNRSKQFVLAWVLMFLLAACSQPNADEASAAPEESAMVDTVSAGLAEVAADHVADVTTDSTSAAANAPAIPAGRLAGAHNLTLQWISWTKPGTITFTTIGEDEYEVAGRQEGVKGDECPECYLTVAGTIKEISPKKLSFTGKIVSSVHHIQDGEPCVKEGTFNFVASGDRKYWRCQYQQGCEGVTDYVDIYF